MANPITDLTNFITGGANQRAQADLANTLSQIEGIETPTAAQLQLGPLDQYTMTGELAPALMQAAATGPSAYNLENISQVPISTMQDVLAQEKTIANAQGMTPQEQAAIAQAEEDVNRNTAGQRGAVAQDFAQRGIPQSLIAAALENQTVGQNAENAYNAALTARANAANQGLTALSNEGALASTLYGQEANQANTVAAAQNALNQFNAANTQAANAANQQTRQAANTYNTTTGQTLANQNVTGENQRRYQNQVEAPQQAAQLALQRGSELENIGEAQAGQQTAQGQQAAGLASGIIGAGATLGSGFANAGALNNIASSMQPQVMTPNAYTPVQAAEGGEIPEHKIPPINFLDGGDVPGKARMPGDTEINDTVPAKLSPGEFVVPRTAMARPEVRNFLARNVPTPRPPMPSAHPSDVASVIRALSMLRAGAGA